MRKINRVCLYILSAIWLIAAIAGAFKIFNGADIWTILKTLAMLILAVASFRWANNLGISTLPNRKSPDSSK